MPTTIEEFRPRVRKGITKIEEYEQGATDRIDLDTLDLYSTTRCASAQAIGGGSYSRGQQRLGIPPNDDVSAEYGFAVTLAEENDDHDGNYANLYEAWVIELVTHRTAKAALAAD
jgi:hypothetical protein